MELLCHENKEEPFMTLTTRKKASHVSQTSWIVEAFPTKSICFQSTLCQIHIFDISCTDLHDVSSTSVCTTTTARFSISDTERERKCIRRREGWLERHLHLVYLAEEG